MSKRRPVDLTPKQSASINTHPRIRQLTRDLRSLPKGSNKYKETVNERRKEKQRLRRELKGQIRHAWTDEQAVDDVERQLQGLEFAPVPTDTAEGGRPQRPAQKRLIKALKAPPATDLEGQYQRRDNAIVAVMAYCTVEEGCTVPRRYSASPKYGHPPANEVDAALLSVFIKNEEDRPRRCFICVGKACSLPPGDPLAQELIHEFFMPGDVTKHLRRKHLGNLKDDESSVCPACDMKLDHKMHLKAHALKIHGTVP